MEEKDFPTDLRKITDVEKMKHDNLNKVLSNKEVKEVLEKLAKE